MLKTTLITLSLSLGNSFSDQPALLTKFQTTIDAARCSHQDDSRRSELVIRDGWVQEGPPSQQITSAYMVIENHGQTDVALLGVGTSAADVIELHNRTYARAIFSDGFLSC